MKITKKQKEVIEDAINRITESIEEHINEYLTDALQEAGIKLDKNGDVLSYAREVFFKG